MRNRTVFRAAALLLAAAVLVGCAAAKAPSAPESAVPVMLETVAAEAPESAEPVRLLRLAQTTDWHWAYEEDRMIEVSVPALFLAEDAESYPELAALLEKTGKEMGREADRLFGELKASPEGLPAEELYSRTETAVGRADSRMLSVLFVTDSYLGGAHPDRSYACLNVESGTGRELRLSDLCPNTESALFRLAGALESRYPDAGFFGLNAELAAEERDGSLVWTAGYEGITFCFAGGTIAPYSDGCMTACLSWRENADILNPEDFEAPGSWAAAFCADQEIFTDPDGCGILHALQAGGTVYDYESEAFEGVFASLDGSGSSREEWCYSMRPYLVHPGNGPELVYLEMVSDNDSRGILVFRLENGTAEAGWEEWGIGLTGKEGPEDSYGKRLTFDPEEFELSTWLDALSTYDGIKTYRTGADGEPETSDALYRIDRGMTLVTVREVPAEDGNGNAAVLLPGTEFTMKETDGSSVVIGETPEGTRVLRGQFAEWPQTVGGLDAEECFEELFFAG